MKKVKILSNTIYSIYWNNVPQIGSYSSLQAAEEHIYKTNMFSPLTAYYILDSLGNKYFLK